MTNVTGDELGRRLFLIQKERAVEDALEKIKHSLNSGWAKVPASESALLKETLEEIWTSVDRGRWGAYSFSRLTREDIGTLATLGKDLKRRQFLTDSALKSADRILSHTED